MGTPEKTNFATKIKLLNIGAVIGQNLDIEDLPSILGKVKTIVLPLVEWLSKPAPAKKRGILFFTSSFLNIWLERSGSWFINFGIHDSDPVKRIFYPNSQELARIMIERSEDFLNLYLVDRDFLIKLPFLRDIMLYDAVVLRVLARFFEDIGKQLQEREERIRFMRERLNLFNDFTQSLDPLVSQGREIPIKEYSIWTDHERGTSRNTGDYLCPKALNPFWRVIDNQRASGGSEYRDNVCEYHAKSIKEFLWRVGYFVDEIREAESKDAKSLLGLNSARLPFIEEELSVLKKLVDSITT